ncbi:unnamed protein product [Gongylonema pulchrum]|uniref:BRCT domain-containing protein n=1 Tax=Gongylonema pulchrum TaxID=637853 RepID=A0A3P7MZ65_9BILA|nr:unnamed protein product [Gongylonema pulchrum]
MKEPNIVFVCDDFTNCYRFRYLRSCGKPIIGPALIRKRAVDGKPLLMPRPKRPLYVDSMEGVHITLSGLSSKDCCEAVDLVHFMGGCARRNFSPSTTHLITDKAKGRTYRVCIFFFFFGQFQSII